MADGSIVIDTRLDADGFQSGANKLGDIIKGLGIFELLKKGVQMVADSVQQAMQRIDTMEQFGRVMTTITGSSAAANRVLAQTNETVLGTAYGLDTAALSVQNFVTRGMDINQATDSVAAWGDAVAFYGNGSNEQLASVTEAVSQMVTKGTVQMDTMNMLFHAGIPAMDIYAEATGQTAEDVADAMQKGALSSEDFITVMNRAFAEGAGKFPSIAGAAKEAGASWSGTFDNMRAAIARGTTSIITSIDNTQASLGRPTMREAIASFGRGFETVLKAVSVAIIPVVENLDVLAIGVGIAAAAFGTYTIINTAKTALEGFKAAQEAVAFATDLASIGMSVQTGISAGLTATQAAQGAVLAALAAGNIEAAVAVGGLTAAETIKTAVTGVLTGQIGLATAAQYLWNAAMNANPLALIITLVAAVVAGVLILIRVLSRGSESYQKYNNAVKDSKKAQEDYNNSVEDSRAAHISNMAAVEQETQKTGQLASEVVKLSAVENKNAADKNKLAASVKLLNEQVEGLNLKLDENGELTEASSKYVKEYFEIAGEVAEINALQDRHNELIKEQNEASQQKIELEYLIKQAEQDSAMSGKERREVIKDLTKQRNEWADKEVEAGNRAIEVEKDLTEASKSGAIERKRVMDMERDALEGVEGNYKQVAAQYNLNADEVLAAASKMEGGLEEYVESLRMTHTSAGETLEELASKWGMTADDVRAEMDEMGVDLDGFVEHMKETTTDAGENIHQLAEQWGTTAEAIQEELDGQELSLQEWKDKQIEAVEAYNEAVQAETESIINGYEKLPTSLDMTFDEMVALMNENADKYEAWRQKMVEVSSMLSPAALAELENLGVGTTEIIDEILADTTGVKAAEMNAAFARVGEAGADGLASKQGMMAETGSVVAGAYGSEATEVLGVAGTEGAETYVDSFKSTDMSGILDPAQEAIDTGSVQIEEKITTLGTTLKAKFDELGATLGQAASSAMDQVNENIRAGADKVKTVIDVMATEVATAATTMMTQTNKSVQTGAQAMQRSFTQLSQSITQTIRSLARATQTSTTTMMRNVTNAVQSGARSIQQAFQRMSQQVTSIMRRMATDGQTQTRQMLQQMTATVTSGATNIQQRFESMGRQVARILQTLKTDAIKISRETIREMASAIGNYSSVTNRATALVNSTANAMRGLPAQVRSIGNQAMLAMLAAMNAYAPTLYARARNIADTIARTLRRALDIRSPSRVIYEIFEMAMLGGINAVADNEAKLLNKFEQIPKNIINTLDKIAPIKLGVLANAVYSGQRIPSVETAHRLAYARTGKTQGSGATHITQQPVINIYGDVNDPDVYRKNVRRAMQVGLAGGRA